MQHPCKIPAILFAAAVLMAGLCLASSEPVPIRSVRVIAGPDVAHLVPGAPLVVEEWQYHDLGVGQRIVRAPYAKIEVWSSPMSLVYDLAATSNRWVFSGGTNFITVAPLEPGTVSRFGIVSCVAPPTVEVWSPARQAWAATVATNGVLCVGSPYPLPYGTTRVVGQVGGDGSLDVDVRRFALFGSSAMSATSGTARVRISWTPAGMPGTEAYAPLPLAAAPASNAIVAVTADLDGNGRYSPGEPYGVYSASSSPYFRPTVTLTGTSPSTWRIDLAGAIANNTFEAQQSHIDRGVLGYLCDDDDSPTLDEMPSTRNFLLALCGQELNGVARRTVSSGGTSTSHYAFWRYSSTARYADGAIWTEANLFEMGIADVGEDYVTDATLAANLAIDSLSAITNATYNFHIYNGQPTKAMTNNVLATQFRNVYESSRTKCVQLTSAGTPFQPGTIPVFRWRSPAVKSYDRCILNIHSAASSGNILFSRESAPARFPDGTYAMALPIGVGWRGRNGQQFVAGSNYWWSVSMIDAKFQAADTTATRRAFSFASE